MDEDRIHRIKIEKDRHDSIWIWIAAAGALVSIWLAYTANTKLFTDNESYRIDLNSIEFPATIDIETRYEIIVRVETPNGPEVRLYDPISGKLLGTIVEQTPSNTPSRN